MEFEITHDPDIFKKEVLLRWRLVWAIKTETHWIYFFVGVFGLFISILQIKNDDRMGPVFLAISLFLFYVSANFIVASWKSKKKLRNSTKTLSDLYLKNNAIIKFQFSDEFFSYADFQQSSKISWTVFDQFLILEETLLIRLKEQETYHFSISKSEVGEEKFSEIITFISAKVKKG